MSYDFKKCEYSRVTQSFFNEVERKKYELEYVIIFAHLLNSNIMDQSVNKDEKIKQQGIETGGVNIRFETTKVSELDTEPY